MLLLDKKRAIAKIVVIFASSEGWNPKNPIEIQLLDPEIFLPITKTTINNSSDNK